ncbi:hypothetical protein OG604_48420 [Streptomyces sp. NBC_01231]|nr:hypothetical protein OG604_48420 [Streptomyces sp. NBC_01231]
MALTTQGLDPLGAGLLKDGVAALVALRVLIKDQAVRAAAEEMITLTYAMRDAYATTEALTSAREAAKVQFVDTAAGYLARTA